MANISTQRFVPRNRTPALIRSVISRIDAMSPYRQKNLFSLFQTKQTISSVWASGYFHYIEAYHVSQNNTNPSYPQTSQLKNHNPGKKSYNLTFPAEKHVYRKKYTIGIDRTRMQRSCRKRSTLLLSASMSSKGLLMFLHQARSSCTFRPYPYFSMTA